jgi:hypothetical protein
MSELLTQNVVKLAAFQGDISDDPALPSVILAPTKVQGIDEIRIIVATNDGQEAEIQVFEGFELIVPPNTVAPGGVNWGNTHEFVVTAGAGVGPGFPFPQATRAEVFSYEVSGECTGITAAWRAPDNVIFEIAVYAVPGK